MTDAIAHNDYAFMKIYSKFCRTKEFMAFLRRAKVSTYYFLRASIIRESDRVKNNIGHGAHASYRKYFLKGMLVGRYSIADIAKYSGTSKNAIMRDIQELEEDGFIKIIRVTTKTGVSINYYQLGTWDGVWGDTSYRESYYLDEYFDKVYNKQRTEQEVDKRDEVLINVMKVYDDFDYFLGVVGTKNSEGELEHLRELWVKSRYAEDVDFIE